MMDPSDHEALLEQPHVDTADGASRNAALSSANAQSAEDEDTAGSGALWSMWNSVSQLSIVRDVVEGAAAATDSAARHVSEQGFIKSVLDASQAAVQKTKEADSRFFNGTLTRIVGSTRDAAESGVKAIRGRMGEPSAGLGGRRAAFVTNMAFRKVQAARLALGEVCDATYGVHAIAASTSASPMLQSYAAAVNSTKERVVNACTLISTRSADALAEDMLLVNMEGFLLEQSPETWTFQYLVTLQAMTKDIKLETVGQAVPVPAAIVAAAANLANEHEALELAELLGLALTGNTDSNADVFEVLCGLLEIIMFQIAVMTALGVFVRSQQSITEQ
jgi:hypothetical protein